MLREKLAKLLARWLPSEIMKDKAFFDLWQEAGYHITPVHFYEPIPDTRCLPRSLWEQPSEMVGVQFEDEAHLHLLNTFHESFHWEYSAFRWNPSTDPHEFFLNNGFLSAGDAEILYCMVRQFQPRRILEIGSGFSSLLMIQALKINQQRKPDRPSQLTCMDPYPRPFIRGIQDSAPDLIEFVEVPIDDLGWDTFQELEENDILFIDSSHVVRTGSDVLKILLDVIPRLKPGVLIHIHDIFLPEEYPEIWIKQMGRFWGEQYLLHAFLAFNRQFRILWPGAYMRLRHPTAVEAAIPSFRADRNWMGSFWIRRETV
jgi:hypothetical protein